MNSRKSFTGSVSKHYLEALMSVTLGLRVNGVAMGNLSTRPYPWSNVAISMAALINWAEPRPYKTGCLPVSLWLAL